MELYDLDDGHLATSERKLDATAVGGAAVARSHAADVVCVRQIH